MNYASCMNNVKQIMQVTITLNSNQSNSRVFNSFGSKELFDFMWIAQYMNQLLQLDQKLSPLPDQLLSLERAFWLEFYFLILAFALQQVKDPGNGGVQVGKVALTEAEEERGVQMRGQ